MRGRGKKRTVASQKEAGRPSEGSKRLRRGDDEERIEILADENEQAGKRQTADGKLPTACPRGRGQAMHNTRSSLGDICKTRGKLMKACLAENSKKAYKNGLTNFEAFRTKHNLPKLWPVSVSQVSLYIACCFQNGYSPSTVRLYVAGLSFMHRIIGLPDPTGTFVVAKLLEGCKRLRPVKDARMPITHDMLAKLLRVLHDICYSDYELLLFKSVFSMAYFGLFRISELIVCSANSQLRALQKDNVVLESKQKALRISLRYTKTNQYGRPMVIRIPKNKETGQFIECVRDYMCQIPAKASLFFCHKNTLPLIRYQFSAVLAKACSLACFNSKNVKCHSFRIGRATDLACQGYGEKEIKLLGRWASDAYLKYIRP